MRCLRCGYCCIEYDVMIIDNPDLGDETISGRNETNVKHKPSGVRCQHLRGDKPGNYSCAIHHHDWYRKTPCFDHGQVEASPDDLCRMGEYILNLRKKNE